jgi:hypothetical protein
MAIIAPTAETSQLSPSMGAVLGTLPPRSGGFRAWILFGSRAPPYEFVLNIEKTMQY